MMSAASSGGVFSNTAFTASMIEPSGSAIASRTSSEVIVDGLRQAVDEIAATDVHRHLRIETVRRADADLDVFRGALADHEIVDAADVARDRLVELVARDADGLADDDAAERDDRDVGRAAADVHHHVAARAVDRQARAHAAAIGSSMMSTLFAPASLAASRTARSSTDVISAGTQIVTAGLGRSHEKKPLLRVTFLMK